MEQIQIANNYSINYLIGLTFTYVNRYLFCHFKELLEKIIQQNIIKILFRIIMYQMPE